MLSNDLPYHDLGGAYFTRRDPERAARRAVSRLNELGFRVTLDLIYASESPSGSHAICSPSG
ncbi:hypothetical protein J2Z21_009133 [Streptomyces griseochromogenes]|uniref:Uncharacterized protein n=1 Tax=Streptomyces griseochromogenes TaxID=68214 RepID=A0A1B1AZ30_9ACTN|nr:hypothetical protein [Streptomyces griseochromogenes]ANP51826.1 hypothetical protein AVL59_21545 [Streptomyces griseochromogenes]MBP2056116.1 hypothetical protein [Streptomyces griseochromogenes]